MTTAIGTIGMQLMAAAVNAKIDILKFNNLSLTEDFFVGEERKVFVALKSHLYKYGVMPTLEVAYKIGIDADGEFEPVEYYVSAIESRRLHQTVKKTLIEAQEHLKSKNPQDAYDLLKSMVTEQMKISNRHKIINFTQSAHDLIKADYTAKLLLGDMYGIRIGWPTMDNMFAGLGPGDLMAIIGRPAQGKTYNLLHMAQHNWEVHHKVPMVVSMEMPALQIVHRLTAMHTHKPITQLKKGEMSTTMYKGILNVLQGMPDCQNDFWIIDGNLSATVQDISVLARQLKPDVVYVDGAYLLQSKSRTHAKWERVAETCEGLKQEVAQELGVPVVASYQFNRSATESKNGGGLENIAGSDVIAQIASIAIGLYQEEGVESVKEKEVRIVKGRNGEVGSFKINWLFDEQSSNGLYMDFSEISKEEIEYEQSQDLGWL